MYGSRQDSNQQALFRSVSEWIILYAKITYYNFFQACYSSHYRQTKTFNISPPASRSPTLTARKKRTSKLGVNSWRISSFSSSNNAAKNQNSHTSTKHFSSCLTRSFPSPTKKNTVSSSSPTRRYAKPCSSICQLGKCLKLL